MEGNLLYSNRKRVLWASETTGYGNDAVAPMLTDGTADIVYQQVREVEVTPAAEPVEVDRARGSASGVKHGFIKGRCDVSLTIPLHPFIGATEQIPHCAPVLKALGLSEDLTTPSESHYKPSTKQTPSMTMYVFMREAETDNWRLYAVTGIRLTGTISFGLRGEAMIECEGGGLYYSVSDPAEFFDPADGTLALQKDGSTAVPARTTGTEYIADQDPLMCKSMDVTASGTARNVESMEVEIGGDNTQIEAMTSDASTIKHILTRGTSGSRVTGSLNLSDYSDVELNSLIDDAEAANEIALSAGFQNAGGRVEFDATNAQIGLPGMEGADGVYNLQVPYYLNGDWSQLGVDNDFDLGFVAAT